MCVAIWLIVPIASHFLAFFHTHPVLSYVHIAFLSLATQVSHISVYGWRCGELYRYPYSVTCTPVLKTRSPYLKNVEDKYKSKTRQVNKGKVQRVNKGQLKSGAIAARNRWLLSGNFSNAKLFGVSLKETTRLKHETSPSIHPQFTLIKKDFGDWLKLNNVAGNIPLSHSLSLFLFVQVFYSSLILTKVAKIHFRPFFHYLKNSSGNGNLMVVNRRRNSQVTFREFPAIGFCPLLSLTIGKELGKKRFPLLSPHLKKWGLSKHAIGGLLLMAIQRSM